MGNFRNDIYGDYIRYTHASCHSYVVMDIGGKILVVNGADNSETKKIYDTLREKCQMNQCVFHRIRKEAKITGIAVINRDTCYLQL